MIQNVPLELKLVNRWCLTGRPDEFDPGMRKAPFICNDGYWKPVSVTDDKDNLWSFEHAVEMQEANPERGIGFVLVQGDGFTCVDLDTKDDSAVGDGERHWALVKELQTYTEVSASGCGYHLWFKGEVNGALKTNEMEVYSKERFIICTGNALIDVPMVADVTVIDFFNEKIKDKEVDYSGVGGPEKESDAAVMAKIWSADHTGKFKALWMGNWDGYLQILREQGMTEVSFDPSRADSAFMGIVTFFTNNFEQCKRIWRQSALGDVVKRYRGDEKQIRAKKRNMGTDYKLNRAIAFALNRNAQDSAKRQEDIELGAKLSANLMAQLRSEPMGKARPDANLEHTTTREPSPIEYPPGMMGELARYYETISIKRIPEFAICEALATAAGLFGRAYNVSGTGLNTYLMVLAASGTGKSHLSKNPEALMTYLERQMGVMGANAFISSKRFTHENAMFQEFQHRTSFCQCLSEFGKIFKNMMSESNVGGALGTVREAMTDIYSKSGQFDRVGGLRYSSLEKCVEIPHAVAYSFLGESVPEPFYNALEAEAFTDGFMSRFLLLEYYGGIPYDTPVLDTTPPSFLAEHMKNATLGVIRALSDPNRVNVVNVTFERDCADWALSLSRYCTDRANEEGINHIEQSLWTRANLKVLKLAALVAVMDCPSSPVITRIHMEWAYRFVTNHNDTVIRAFRTGRMASSDRSNSREAELLKQLIVEYYVAEGAVRSCSAYDSKTVMEMKKNNHIPWSYISRHAGTKTCFKAPAGSGYKNSDIVRTALNELMAWGVLMQVPQEHVRQLYNFTGKVYQLVG